MDRPTDSRVPRRLIDAAAKARFLAALRAGAARGAAAGEAGFPLKSLYDARRRDPLFRLGWIFALELSAADQQAERLSRRGAGPDPVRIASNGGRIVQRRRMRWVRFTEDRQQVFLDHFAGTADAAAAAEAAGISYATVYAHRRRDPDFAARWEEALHLSYPRLQAETLRRRLEAQRRIRDGLAPAGEVTEEFDRAMKLLARWDRRGGGIGQREVGPGRLKRMEFGEAMELLERRMRALGIRRPGPPAPDAAEEG